MTLLTKTSQNQAAAAAERDLKQRVHTCLHKLSDRDTHASAAMELEAIAKSLSANTIPSFISSITATDSSDKSVVRKQCINLISVLAFHHGDLLFPYVSKLLFAVLRRLRDRDSAIRSACISAVASIASHVTKPSFSTLCKPFLEALFTEQDLNSQVGTATCLTALIEAAAEPDLLLLRKAMVRFEKLVKCESFKAKPAVLVLIGSVIEMGVVAGSKLILGNLVPCLVEVLSSEDWAVRKAAAEALIKIAVVENEALLDFKAPCLKTFEAKKFDKVKAVRETMNQMVEVWKDISVSFDKASVSPAAQSYSNDSANDGPHPHGSKTSCTITSSSPSVKKKNLSDNSRLHDGSPSIPDRKISPLSTDKRKDPAMFRKLDRKKSSDLKADISKARSHSAVNHEHKTEGSPEDAFEKGENENRLTRSGVKQTVFPTADPHVAQFLDEKSVSTVYYSNETKDNLRSHKEGDHFSLIHQQLLQIENQQSHLLNILQKFMGSSESGIHSLETRVNGLEHALDEISFELAISTGRLSNNDSARMVCCNLPGTEFLIPKFWRRTCDDHFANSSGNSICGPIQTRANRYSSNPETLELVSRRYRLRGGRGIIVNPLAKKHGGSQGGSEALSVRLQ